MQESVLDCGYKSDATPLSHDAHPPEDLLPPVALLNPDGISQQSPGFRVARNELPWAGGHNPVGIGEIWNLEF